MDKDNSILDVLNIPKHHFKWLSKSRTVCLVPEDWLQNAVNRTLSTYKWTNQLCSSECDQYLASSNTRTPHQWFRISVKILRKSDQLVSGLPDEPFSTHPDITSTLHSHLAEISKDNYSNQWQKAYHDVHQEQKAVHKNHQKGCDVLRQYLQSLYPEQMADLYKNNTIAGNCGSFPNLLHAIKIYETHDAFLVIQPFILYNIQNVVAFSPAIFKSSCTKPLFVLYQLLHILKDLHRLGIVLGDITLHDVLCDDKLWVYISGLKFEKYLHLLQARNILRKNSDNQIEENSQIGQNSNSKQNRTNSLLSRNGDQYDEDLNRSSSSSDQSDLDSVTKATENPTCSRLLSETDTLVEEARAFLQSDYRDKYSVHNLPDLVEDWVHRRITNFKYLMVLNHLAGRCMYDPNNHPFLPWIIDFSIEKEEFVLRDLTKSKYRLNKGDSQLDLTFESYSVFKDSSSIPHHVSDVLSDITYYVYKARRTPKSVLCSHVRPKWVPNEYPSSMVRMYNWTPDECIPEFFIDPLIFSSIHEDLPDIELPVGCKTQEEFIVKHMELLESDRVSECLHHWIDLTFGFKLSGSIAVKEKNINLQLVDDHKNVTNHGVVQLFIEPHPYRISKLQKNKAEPPKIAKNVLWSQLHGLEEVTLPGERRLGLHSQTAQRPETATIILPKHYDPLASLNQLEVLYNFTSQNMGQTPQVPKQQEIEPVLDSVAHVMRDMHVFGCLMCEMFLYPVLYMEESNTCLLNRWRLICKYYTENSTALPRSIQRAVDILLNIERYKSKSEDYDFHYSMMTSADMPPPSPSQLLSPYVGILPFPDYFPSLYEYICKLKEIDRKLEQIQLDSQMNVLEKQRLLKVTAREKVTIMQKYLEKNQGILNDEGIELILPHLKELFENHDTRVQAAWSLFNLIGLEIELSKMKSQFLPCLVKLYNVEYPTPKYMKIYHKSFIVQLILRLGLDTYLTNFSTTLVEAVAGYKDYVFEDLYTEQSDVDSLFEKNSMQLPVLKEENGKHGLNPRNQETNYSEKITPDDVDDIEDETGDENSRELDDQSNSDFSTNDEDQSSLQSLDEADDRRKHSDDTESAHSVSAVIGQSEIEGEEMENVLQFQCSEELEEEEVTFGPDSDYKQRLGSVDEYVNRKSNYVQGSHMIRSETDEFAKTMSDRTASEVINIRDVSKETIKWLAHRLGPFLSAKYLSRNLLRMMVLCYLGEEQLMSIEDKDDKLKSSRLILGDKHAEKVIKCLVYIAQLYGEQVILLQYIPSIIDLVDIAKKRLTAKAEAGLVSSLVLLRHLIPQLADKTLMDILKETIIKDILQQVIRAVASPSHNFPSGSTMRTVICHKFVDVVYILGIRIGFEMTRQHMTGLLKNFFVCFNPVNDAMQSNIPNSPETLRSVKSNASIDDSFCNIRIDDSTQEYTIGTPVSLLSYNSLSPQMSPIKMLRKQPHSLSINSEDREESSERAHGKEDIQKEMADVFNPELAMASYIPFCRIFGSIHMEQCLSNDDLIRQLCSQYDSSVGEYKNGETENNSTEGKEEINVEMTGNKIQLNQQKSPTTGNFEMMSFGPIHRNSKILTLDPELTRCSDMEKHRKRHLRGNWLAYWEHELGLSERDTLFNFKQIKLQTFEGHSSSIKTLTVLDNENSFISSSKDRTVKLWSVKSFGDGTGKCRSQWTYKEHKKSIYSLVFLESVRLVASCDSNVHVWDPFTTDVVRVLDSTKYSPVTALASLPTPSSVILTANTDSQLRILDLRTIGYAHEYRCTTASAGLIRCMAVSPDSQWVAVGFSSGIMSLLNLKTGIMLGTWKGHEGEIIQMKAFSNNKFISCSYDQTVKVWNADDIKDVIMLKGHTEPVHCISMYKHQLITATTGNKIGVHSSPNDQGSFTSMKLRSDTFKGVLTSMAVLPLNRMLLLGADNGSIRLFC